MSAVSGRTILEQLNLLVARPVPGFSALASKSLYRLRAGQEDTFELHAVNFPWHMRFPRKIELAVVEPEKFIKL